MGSDERNAWAGLYVALERLFNLATECRKAGNFPPPDCPDLETPEHFSFMAAMQAIDDGIPCPEWAAKVMKKQWDAFKSFEYTTLGEAFGILPHKHRKARRNELLCAAMYSAVRGLQSKKIPLNDNAASEGALSIVGREFGVSAKDVEAKMKRWRKLCATTKSDPDRDSQMYADSSAIVQAFANGMRQWNEDST